MIITVQEFDQIFNSHQVNNFGGLSESYGFVHVFTFLVRHGIARL